MLRVVRRVFVAYDMLVFLACPGTTLPQGCIAEIRARGLSDSFFLGYFDNQPRDPSKLYHTTSMPRYVYQYVRGCCFVVFHRRPREPKTNRFVIYIGSIGGVSGLVVTERKSDWVNKNRRRGI